jgi:23S rRNA (uracil1939-C5)-methyltransferase
LASDEVNARLTELRQSHPRSGHYSLRQSNLPPSGFFQANDLLLTRFQELGAQLFSSNMCFAVDAYSGAGFFTTKLLERFKSVTAIEKDPRLVKDLNRLDSPALAVVEGDVAVTLAPVLEKLDLARTALLLDPPREGLAPPVLQHILDYPPAELVYVSCDPAALARDSKTLAKKFQLRSVQPVDLFPRTAQIECVTCWLKR